MFGKKVIPGNDEAERNKRVPRGKSYGEMWLVGNPDI